MAVKIPTYDDRLSPEGFVTPQARATEISGAVGAGLQNLGNAGTEYVTNEMKLARYDAQQQKMEQAKVQAKQDADAVANMYDPLSKGQVYWNDYLVKNSQSMVNGGNVQDDLGTLTPLRDKTEADFNKWSDQFLAGITNDKAYHLAQQHLATMRTHVLDSAMRMQATADVQNRSDKVDSAVGNWASQAANGGVDPLQLVTTAKQMIANSGFDEHTRNLKALAATKTIVEAAIQGEIKRNPIQTRDALIQRFGIDPNASQPAPGATSVPGATINAFSNAVSFTLQHEGGLNPKDTNGTPSKFGINAQANPDVNLATLTKDGATQIYKSKYWDAIGGDELAKKNMALATVAFDTAVISGVGKAKELLNQADGDPQKLLRLRADFLASLLEKNYDKYGPYADAWHKRQLDLIDTVKSLNSQGSQLSALPVNVVSAPAAPVSGPLKALVDQLDTDRLHAFIGEAQTESTRQQAVFRSQITATEGDHIAAFMNGAPVAKPLSAADYTSAYGPIDGPQRFANYQQIQQMGGDINALKLQTPDQMQATLSRYQPDPSKPGYELASKRYDTILKAADQINTARQTDPMAYAIQAKIGDAKPLPFNDPAAFGAELAKRVGVATTMQQNYQTPLNLLTKAEQTTLNQGFERMTTQQRLGYLSAINSSIKDPTAYRTVMQQIAPDSPVTAMAGVIMSKQNPVIVTHMMSADQVFQQRDVAGIMLEGEALLNPNKLDKSENGKGKTFPLPKEQDMRDQFISAVGKAFAGDPNGANFAYQAVKAYYVGKAARDGDVSGQIDSGRLKDAINAVVGGVTDVNGKGEVVRPWGMNEERFTNGAKAAFTAQMQANGYQGTALDNWGAYGLQSAGDSKYLVRSGTGYLTDRTGNPLILDLTEKPSMADQIPGQRPVAPQVAPPATITQNKTAKPNIQQPKTK